jgi:type VI secretion system Hcp family effector
MTTRNSAKRTAMTLAAAILMGVSATTFAAQDLVAIQMTGVPGDAPFTSANGLPTGSIEVLQATLGLTTPVSFSSGVHLGVPNFQDLMIAKKFNNSSPAIALAEITGSQINTATLTFYTGNAGSWTRYYTIILTGVYVTSIGLSDSEGGNSNETVGLAYAQIKLLDNVTGATECFNRSTNNTC